MSIWRYRFAGLLIESMLHIPEWDVFRTAAIEAAPDASIVLAGRTGDAAADLEAREQYRFSVSGLASYVIEDGRRLVVQPEAGADIDEVRVYILGTALAALFCQRGLLLLHASVVRLGDRSVALCGPSGAGKSSLAAALVDRGGSFVCDDVARFDACTGRALVYPSTPRLKLAPRAVERLGWPAAGARVHARAVKFYVPQVHADPWSPVPLDVVCVLDWTAGPVCLSRVTGLRALRSLVAAATYRAGFFESRAQQAAHVRQCAAIVSSVAVYRLQRPRSWHDAGEAVDLLGRLLDRP